MPAAIMSDTAVHVAGIGKQYHLGAAQARYSTLRDQLRTVAASSLRALVRRGRRAEAKPSFWALKDVSFDVKQGDVVGIIGRNGAGKSTLLKILSRITEPTEGSADIRGRVGSLLEVGTGFHPELTGRENVFLNGAILGMTRAEIKRRFDEIVAFAEVEKFIDTPVKHYSSGMYMRLAFAVAAHLEPEILIVDEVLAVGDAEFQAKCLGKMGQAAKSGRTVLFVSHNLTAIRNLCSCGIVLQQGRVAFQGDAASAADWYVTKSTAASASLQLADRTDRTGSGRAKITGFEILNEQGSPVATIASGETVTFRIACRTASPLRLDNVVGSVGIGLPSGSFDLLLRSTFGSNSLTIDDETTISCTVRDFPLADGNYSLTLFLSYRDSEVLDWVVDAATLTVAGGDFFGTGSAGLASACRVLTRSDWTSQRTS